ncbi:hypothetical protein [Amycolatopsis jejuensis]|uniref:hypothetical protein n=1 Tax=Amycolatopsis jejuensis TaxID=330084 RepID=UPI000525ECAA|nr:hypothetical protein [Amycolatopsis jejuensis]
MDLVDVAGGGFPVGERQVRGGEVEQGDVGILVGNLPVHSGLDAFAHCHVTDLDVQRDRLDVEATLEPPRIWVLAPAGAAVVQ